MAKLLTHIWKTASGPFFETKEEALKAERKAAELAVKAAMARAMLPAMDKYVADRTEGEELMRKRRPGELPSSQYPPANPQERHKLPPGFPGYLLDALVEAGIVAPLKLSGEEPPTA